MFCLPECCKIVEALTPASDAAGRTGAYVSLKNAIRAYIVVSLDQGAANTVQIDPKQASAIAGTGVKAITAVPIWSNLDCAASDALVRRTAAVNYTTDAGVKHKQVIFQIDPAACMDIANGFDCLTVTTGASHASNITQAIFVIEERYGQATPPTAVTD